MALSNGKNYYEILGVTPDSDVSEIKAAYRKLARKYHPDVNDSAEAVAKFKAVTEAYETLSDNVKRNKYNTLYGFFKSYKSSQSGAQYKKSKEPKFEDRTINKTKKENSSSTEHKAEEKQPQAKKPEKEYKEESSKSGTSKSETSNQKTKSSKNI